MAKRLFLDMDGTLARFHDVDKTFIEAMWQPGFYTGLKPFVNMVEGIKTFIKDHPDVEVYVLSAVLDTEPPFVVDEKNAWLDHYLPEIPAERRIFTRAGENKADYIGAIGDGDFLVDDYNKNLHEFQAAGAHSIKFRNDVNHQGKGAYGGEKGPLWDGDIISYNDIPESIAQQLAHLMVLSIAKEHEDVICYSGRVFVDFFQPELTDFDCDSFCNAAQKLVEKRLDEGVSYVQGVDVACCNDSPYINRLSGQWFQFSLSASKWFSQDVVKWEIATALSGLTHELDLPHTSELRNAHPLATSIEDAQKKANNQNKESKSSKDFGER